MKIVVIDGNSILNRAYYGIKLLTNKDGLFTNAIYGFLTTYLKIMDSEKPDKAVVCFDVRAKTFRHEMFEDYKGTRKGMDDELACQIPVLKEVLDALGINRYEKAGFEADDLMGTISQFCNENNHQCVVVTGDKDSLQLASENTEVNLISTRMGQTTTKKFTKEVFIETYGFEPMILCDLKGLMGDSSDNIPGVKGVGEKTAMTLLHEFGTIEGIYENIESDVIKKGAREKLKVDVENAYKSRELATIIKDVEFDFDINKEQNRDEEKLLELFEMLEFKAFPLKFNVQATAKELPKLDVPKFKQIVGMSEISINAPIFVNVSLEKIAFILNDKGYVINNPTNEDFEILFSEKIEKIMHNPKDFLVKMFDRGIMPKGIIFDTAIAGYLKDPSKSEYNIFDMCEEILGVKPEIEESQPCLFDTEEKDDEFTTKAYILSRIYPEIALGEMKSLYYDIELPLMTVLADMQSVGVKVDTDALKIYGAELLSKVTKLTEEILEISGETFNLNSPKQLGEILFEKLELPHAKKTKTGYSTNADVLENLKEQHEIIPKILEYRMLSKLHSTYVEGLLKVVKNDGKIHSTLNQMVTTTGRLSSTEPNLQNIPVRTAYGRELRKMFVVENDDYTLIDADYSQIELRVLAHISNDETMIKAFADGIDIHTVTASQVFDVSINDVTSEMRSHAKAVNFGIVYGISEFSLGNDIGVTRKEAKQYIDNYLEKYSGVANYMENIKKKAHEDLFVTTLYGRKRMLPELTSGNFNMRSFGERVALNTPIQGTAADIIKIAMVNVYYRMKNEKLKSRLILQIHDELIIEATNDEKDYVANLLKEEMENAFSGKVKLLVEYNFGKNWYEAK